MLMMWSLKEVGNDTNDVNEKVQIDKTECSRLDSCLSDALCTMTAQDDMLALALSLASAYGCSIYPSLTSLFSNVDSWVLVPIYSWGLLLKSCLLFWMVLACCVLLC
jgi:hypothetical protein